MENKIYYQVAAVCNFGSSLTEKPIAFFDQRILATDYQRKISRVLNTIYPSFPMSPFPFSPEDIQFLNKKFPEAQWEDLFYCDTIDEIKIIECEEIGLK